MGFGKARSVRSRARDLRHSGLTLLAGLGLLTVAFISGPVALADTANAGAAGRVDAADVASPEEITIADLRQLVDELTARGEVTLGGSWRLHGTLDLAELYLDRGFNQRAILALELFKQAANDPIRVLTEDARAALSTAADQLIAQLSGA